MAFLAVVLAAAAVVRAETIGVKVLDHEGKSVAKFHYDAKASWPFEWSEDVYVCSDADSAPVAGLPCAEFGPGSGPCTLHTYTTQRPNIFVEVFKDSTLVATRSYTGPTSFTVPTPGLYRIRCSTTFQVDDLEIQPLLGTVINPITGKFTVQPSFAGRDSKGKYQCNRIELHNLSGQYFYYIYKRYTYNVLVETLTYVSPGESDKALLVLPRHPDIWAGLSQLDASTVLQDLGSSVTVASAKQAISQSLQNSILNGRVLYQNFLASQAANVILCLVSPEYDLTLSSAAKSAIGWSVSKIVLLSLEGATGVPVPGAVAVVVGVAVAVAVEQIYDYYVWQDLLADLAECYGDDMIVTYCCAPFLGTLNLLNQGTPMEDVKMGTLREFSGSVTEHPERGLVAALDSGCVGSFQYVIEPPDCLDCVAVVLVTPPVLAKEGQIQIRIPLSSLRVGTIPDISGQVTANLLPSAAVTAGAMWRLDTGSWLSSGTSVSALSGPHTVGYQAVTGYATPSPTNIFITPGQTALLQASYSQLGNAVTSLVASADTYVSLGFPTFNYEGSSLVVAGPDYAGWRIDSLCRFNCTAIPPGSTVNSVELQLEQYAPTTLPTSFQIRVYECANGWNPATVTWNLRPTYTTLVATKNWSGNQWSFRSADSPALLTLVSRWVNDSSSNYGIELMSPAGSSYAYFGSIGLSGAAPPRLVVYYTPPADTQGDSIANLRAKTSSSGSTINQNTWQRDNSPYFYWDVPSSAMPIIGYSFAVDAQPDQTIDVTVPYFQYASGCLANGQHVFRVKSVDANGNWSPTPASFNIWVDREPPANGTIAINNGASNTTSFIVNLNNLSATDARSGVSQTSFSNDGSAWTSWESHASNKNNWDLSAYGGGTSAGARTVYVRFKDRAGNVSAAYADTIELVLVVNPPLPPMATAATIVTASGFVANWNSPGGAMGYRLDVTTNAMFSNYVSGYRDLDVGNVISWSVSALSAKTVHYYRVRATNNAGASSNSAVISVTTKPIGPLPPTGLRISGSGEQ